MVTHKAVGVNFLEKKVDGIAFEDLAHTEPLLVACLAASARNSTALGERAGLPVQRVLSVEESLEDEQRSENTVAGFNLHASHPIGATDRAGLERQLRYMGRPPLSQDRLSQSEDRRIIVKLKKAWRDGTSHIILSPLELIERLAAIIPPPRKNQIHYHGVFAPNAKSRAEIVPKRVESTPSSPNEETDLATI